ncbi:BlaI/MecI/CopY family transcriptional regulator [Solimicrobium silvestre]|uniref:Putative transcriptional regulator n=1 Tax=Solimicrobium silvestre TaxID=2099400 RepID=A0A2S9H3T7_9BURK|nr:BlaI/MecI/CopY family transcriptional regulator [Solimicrobium silvestre]PRC94593.1 putative transcriptional regulator [Solimicrobium silvestre]
MTDPHPTEGELAILRILWDRKKPSSVREVHEALLQTKDTAYTTVLKMLTIMNDKELVRRDETERSHRYTALYSEPVVQSSMLKSFVQNAFAGSAFKLVQRALDDDTASAEELDAIARLIAEAKKRRM